MLVNYGRVFNDLQRCLKISVTSGTHQPLLFIPEGKTQLTSIYLRPLLEENNLKALYEKETQSNV